MVRWTASLICLCLSVSAQYGENEETSSISPPSYIPSVDEPTLQSSANTETSTKTVVATKMEKKDKVDKKQDFRALAEEMSKLAKNDNIACPSDVLFVVDSSGSFKNIFGDVKQYLLKVIEGLTISDKEDRVGVVIFGGPTRHSDKIRLGEIKDSEKLFQRIKKLPFLSGITATGAALNFTRSSLKNRRTDVQTSVVVLTDGYSFDLIGGAAKRLHDMENVRVFSVSVGESYVKEELELISGAAERVFFGQTSYAQLLRQIKSCGKDALNGGPRGGPEGGEIVKETTTKSSTEGTDREGRHLIPNVQLETVDETVKRQPTLKQVEPSSEENQESTDNGVQARMVGETGTRCQNDVIFLFDASGSLYSQFVLQLRLANQLIDSFVLGPQDTQVAVVKYASRHHSRVLVNFTSEYDGAALKKLIASTAFMGGTTFTNEALMKAADLLQSNGARRSGANPIVIVFTDGFSMEDPSDASLLLRGSGVTIFAVGVEGSAGRVNMKELNTIAGDGSRVFVSSTFSQLVQHMNTMREKCPTKQHKL